MTRFARSKGSKASNERLPEEATPWSEMKKQLSDKNKETEENKSRKDAFEKRNANYKAFLEEKEKASSENSNWAEFPGSVNSSMKENKKKKHRKSLTTDSSPKQNNDKITEKQGNDSDDAPEEQSSKKEVVEAIVKKKKGKPKKLLKILEQDINSKNNASNNQNDKPPKKRKLTEGGEGSSITKKFKKSIDLKKVDTVINETDVKSEKNLEGKEQKKKLVKENLTEVDLRKIEKKKQRRLKQVAKRKLVKAELKKQKEQKKALENSESKTDETQTEISIPKSFDKYLSKNTFPKKPFAKSNNVKEKQKKPRDKEDHPRKKPMLPHKMFINGKELEIDYVDGFPVKKEDALRLKKLRREMISKGLPRSEIDFAMKLERRKAEKAFTREKKRVCFHCRKSGHNLSECPEVDKNEVAQTTATGICFKCGSTEHTHFECKVVRGQEFKYATCFICKEQGHIARQCPDNARGLYPKGGACKVCGDVTHLKKDCPKYQAQQQRQEENLRIETLGNSNPDVLEEKYNDNGPTGSKRHNKIIKF
ncbi:stress response protein NST1-like [Anoplophora glabripennis]|uniref:stress response protein NST1-like n=1 Tax=Anoplophora glabripennis TaxID=217634 RepID=UPI000873D2F6|nr:stress response protein NST1-like [Anoplophora glabripennis]